MPRRAIGRGRRRHISQPLGPRHPQDLPRRPAAPPVAAALPRSPSTWMKRRSTPSSVQAGGPSARSSCEVGAAHGVDQARVKPLGPALADAVRGRCRRSLDRAGRSLVAGVAPSRLKLKTSTSAGVTRVQDVVEQIAVGVDGDAGESEPPGAAHGLGQIRVQAGLAAQEHHVRARAAFGEDRQPAFDAARWEAVSGRAAPD